MVIRRRHPRAAITWTMPDPCAYFLKVLLLNGRLSELQRRQAALPEYAVEDVERLEHSEDQHED
eukprot:28672-Eustigmatos_ZCMA.PRE.1